MIVESLTRSPVEKIETKSTYNKLFPIDFYVINGYLSMVFLIVFKAKIDEIYNKFTINFLFFYIQFFVFISKTVIIFPIHHY